MIVSNWFEQFKKLTSSIFYLWNIDIILSIIASYLKADRENIEVSKAKEELKIIEGNWMDENNINLNITEDYLKAIDFRNKVFK